MLYNLFTLAFAFLVLVSFHELGHYLAAKWAGVKVHKFALGFPPWIFSIKLGETVYAFGMTLMGGFVRMQGEEMIVGENEQLDDRDYRKKPIWKRAIIILAGPVFSLLLALPITMYCLSSGLRQAPPVVGPQPDTARFVAAGLQPGDRIVEMDGTPIYHRNSMIMHLMLNNKSNPVAVVALRTEIGSDGRQIIREVRGILPAFADGFDPASGGSMFMAGLDQPMWYAGTDFEDVGFKIRRLIGITQVAATGKDNQPSPAARAGLQVEDELVAINGYPMETFYDLQNYVAQHGDKSLTLYIRRADNPQTLLPIEIQPDNIAEAGQPPVYRVGIAGSADWVVTEVTPGSEAAKTGVQVGMRLVLHEDENGSEQFVSRYSKNPLNPATGERYTDTGNPLIETGFSNRLQFDFYRPNAGQSWAQYVEGFKTQKPTPVTSLSVKVVPNTLSERMYLPATIKVEPQPLPEGLSAVGATRYEHPDFRAEYQQVRGVGNLATATWIDFQTQGWRMLQSLKKIVVDIFSRDTKALGGLAGPLGIGSMLWKQGNLDHDLAFNQYLMFIGFISINLGIMNLLPIPILDGGHLMMMAIEAVRRKPPSKLLIERFQITGLVILLGLFLLATGMDVYHMFFPR